MKALKKLWVDEPTMVIATTQTLIALAVGFGLHVSMVQVGLILAVLTSLGGLTIRSQVSSVAALKKLKEDTAAAPLPPIPLPPATPTPDTGAITLATLFLIVAIVLFVWFAAVGAGWVTMKHPEALLGFGLAAFATAHLPLP